MIYFVHSKKFTRLINVGKPSDLFDQTNPDWAPSLKLAECLTPRKSESNLKQTTGCTNR